MRIEEVEQKAPEALIACLREIPFVSVASIEPEVTLNGQKQVDFLVWLDAPDGKQAVVAEVKRSGEPRYARGAVGQLLQYLQEMPDGYGIFIAPYVTERTAQILDEAGIGYVDLAGNCRIVFDRVYIRREGRENPFSKKRVLRSLFAPKASRVLRVLLSDPGRSWTTTELAEEANVSLGHISNVRQLLLDKEWIDEAHRGIRLAKPDDLLRVWAEEYDDRKNERHLFYSFDAPGEVEEKLGTLQTSRNFQYALTAFSGAERYAPHVRYQRASVFVEGDVKAIAEALQVKPVDSGANVELIEPYDEGVFYGAEQIDSMWVASPVQLYLDLQVRPGRGEEAAEFLFNEILRPSWQL